jgi:hypothetical protein
LGRPCSSCSASMGPTQAVLADLLGAPGVRSASGREASTLPKRRRSVVRHRVRPGALMHG